MPAATKTTAVTAAGSSVARAVHLAAFRQRMRERVGLPEGLGKLGFVAKRLDRVGGCVLVVHAGATKIVGCVLEMALNFPADV